MCLLKVSYSKSTSESYRSDVDGLRALAIFSVVLFHAFPDVFTGGFVGVDVFFAISGYLISSIIIRALLKNDFKFFDFYARRIRRIFPSLILVLLFSFSVGWFVLLPDEFSMLGRYIAGGSVFIDNFIAWNDAGYFDKNAELKPLLHLWSLAIEEQFYLFLPLLLWTSLRFNLNILIALLLIIIFSFWLNLQGVSVNPTATFYAPWSRMWELLIGGLLACFQINKPLVFSLTSHKDLISWLTLRERFIRNFFAFIGLALLTYGVFNFNRSTVYPGMNALVPILGALLLISVGPDTIINRSILSNKFFVFFGLISYPFYLWHWAFLSFLHVMIGGEPSVAFKLSAIALSIFFSWFTYIYIESPLRFGEHRAAKTIFLCVALMVGGVLGCYVYIHEGIPSRLAKLYQNISLVNDVKESDIMCKEKYSVASRYCLLSNIDKPATVVLMGDSHANRLFKPLSFYYSKSNDNLLQLGQAGCLPLLGVDSSLIKVGSKCSHFTTPQLNYIVTDNNIKTVILAYYGRYYLSGVELDKPNELVMKISLLDGANITNRIDIYKKGLQLTLEKIIKSGKKAIVVIDAPDFAYDPKTCVSYSRPYSSIFTELNTCIKPLSDVLSEDAGYAQSTYEVVNKMGAQVINLRDSMCKEGLCRATKDGLLLYRDKDHLNPLGAFQVVNELWPQLQ